MKIHDLVENILHEESDEELLQGLLSRFRADKRTHFKNATHKYNTVRKTYANELDDEDKKAQVMKISAGEFFNFLKSQKKAPTPKPEPKPEPTPEPETPKEKPELVPPTLEDLKGSTAHAVIAQWVRKYGDFYSNEELYDVLYNKSPVGDYEDAVYVRRHISDERVRIKSAKEKEKKEKLYPQMQRKFRNSSQTIESLKGSDDYEAVINDIIKEVKGQPRVVGQKPKNLSQLFGYIKNTLQYRYDAQAFKAFEEGKSDKEVQSLVNKRDIAKKITKGEVQDYMDS